MNQLLERILALHHLDFMIVDRSLNILEHSPGSQRFAERPGQIKVGEDSRLNFPELIGLEDVFYSILAGEAEQFQLTAIGRAHSNQDPLYFNFYALAKTDDRIAKDRLIFVFEDVTEQNVLEQKYVQITNDITLVNQKLSAYQNYLQYIIKYMADALFVTNEIGNILQCNEAAQNLLEAKDSELVNRPIHQIFKEIKLFPKFINHQLNKLSEGKLFIKDLEVTCTRKSGLVVTILFNCSVIDIDDRKHFVYIGRDITERKKNEQEMQIALKKERELNEIKSNFLSMTSHEFRTPLTVILSAAEVLEYYKKQESDSKHIKYISQIQRSVENLLELLDNLLLIGQADSRQLSLQRTLINLEIFCSNLIEELEDDSKIPRIYLVNRCQEIIAEMDEKILRHILTNLLSNALKYSSDKTPVYLKLDREKNTVIFEIEDQGIGITLEDKKHLFELFHRGQNVQEIPGTGLGLAIVKKSVELYGGNLTVSSKVGVGTTFKVNLPLN